MLKVLSFGRLHGASHGGIERHVHGLIAGLSGRVSFVNLVPSRDGRFHAHASGPAPVYEVQTLGTVASVSLCPALPIWARRLHRQRGFDLIHLHFPDPMSHFAALALPRSLPIVVSWHSDIVRQKLLGVLYRPMVEHLLRRASAVVVGTPAHYRSSRVLPECDLEEKLAVVPYGVDFAGLTDDAAAIADVRRRHGRRLIFALGRHVYYKGFEYLLDALPAVPDARLLLGGEGPLTGRLRERAAGLGLGERVVFLGRIDDAQLPAYYRACDVFCMPSVELAEAFGFVQVEAMACGKPVVCCDLENGVTYVNRHGETGLVVPPRDALALAAALRTLLDAPDLARSLGAAASARVRGEFSIAAQAEGMLRVYESVSVQRG
jgi:rhamnosyl/mannosyltransferase